MSAPLDKKVLMAGLEEFENHLRRSGIAIESKDGALANFPPLVRKEDARQSAVEPRGQRPIEPRRNDGDSAKREILHKLESGQRTAFAAIEAGLNDARRNAARTDSLGAAASNTFPNPTDGLKPERDKVGTVVSDPVAVGDASVGSRVSFYILAGIVMFGLCGLGVGMAFWNNAPNSPGASTIATEIEPAKPSLQSATSADIPAPRPSMLDSSASPIATSGGDAEQRVDTSRQQAESPPAIARRDGTGLADQAVGAPAPPAANQMQAEPAATAALPEPKKAENMSAATLNGALRPSDMQPLAAATPSPPRDPLTVAPASAPKAAPRAVKAPKPSVAAKLGDRRQPERIAKPGVAAVAEKVAPPDTTQPPITQAEAPAPKPAAAPESNGASAYIQRAQQAVGSLTGVVKNWVGMDTGPRP